MKTFENKIINGDAVSILKELPDNFIDCVVTSPPYYGLRDYGTGKWIGGDSSCDHQGCSMRTKANINRNCGTGRDKKNRESKEFFKKICKKCGAERVDHQIGLEETPEEYIEKLVSVFREVKRVVKDEGTLWLNIGDSYAGSGKGGAGWSDNAMNYKQGTNRGLLGKGTLVKQYLNDCKPKDLIGIPWMLAFALRSDGWYLRQDIIWAKPNPMPESVSDRCTKSHEYIFLLSKSKQYYFDQESLKECSVSQNVNLRDRESTKLNNTPGRSKMKGLIHNNYQKRNKRSVWTIPTAAYKDAHFAVFPEKLIVDCIKAGSPENGIVLDPFSGSGTTFVVARKLNRRAIGIELNPDYVNLANKRLLKELGLFI